MIEQLRSKGAEVRGRLLGLPRRTLLDVAEFALYQIELRAAMALRDIESIQAVLLRTVEDYRPDPQRPAHSNLPAAQPAQSRAIH